MQTGATPHYQRIKQDLLQRITAGEWLPGQAIPAEAVLAEQFSVARMTVNRALQELARDGVLLRRRGSGTYVAPPPVQTSLLQIRNIADEVTERGHVHDCQLFRLERVQADVDQAAVFAVERGAWLFRSVLVHREDGVPIQAEDRLVLPALVPDYLAQDFTRQTPSAYLMAVAPLQAAHYTVEARLASREIAGMLAVGRQSACLVVRRTTHGQHGIVSLAELWHPGQRYRLTGGVQPSTTTQQGE